MHIVLDSAVIKHRDQERTWEERAGLVSCPCHCPLGTQYVLIILTHAGLSNSRLTGSLSNACPLSF